MSLLELQFTVECAFISDSAENLKLILTHSADLYRKQGLNINIQKTEFLSFNARPTVDPVNPMIDGENLKVVTSIKYLGSNISAICTLCDEISYRICQENGAYERLRATVMRSTTLALKPKFQCTMLLSYLL